MTDITTIPTIELKSDLQQSLIDIEVCETALSMGFDTYGPGKDVAERFDINRKIVVIINEELRRREE